MASRPMKAEGVRDGDAAAACPGGQLASASLRAQRSLGAMHWPVLAIRLAGQLMKFRHRNGITMTALGWTTERKDLCIRGLLYFEPGGLPRRRRWGLLDIAIREASILQLARRDRRTTRAQRQHRRLPVSTDPRTAARSRPAIVGTAASIRLPSPWLQPTSGLLRGSTG
jgi:hypothetical protein